MKTGNIRATKSLRVDADPVDNNGVGNREYNDIRYCTGSEVDTISGSLQTNIDGKSDLTHLHDDRYYTETELNNGQLDNRYYTELEVDDLITTISGKLDDHNELNNLDYASAGHTGFQPSGDYVTDSELTTLSGNLQTNIDGKIEDGTATGQMTFWNGTKWVKTETSELFWDDANKVFVVGAASSSSADPVIVVGRSATGSGNAHSFVDESSINKSGTIGYNSFDSDPTITGSENYNHVVGFQSRPSYRSSGNITKLLGFTSAIDQTSPGGTITNAIHYKAKNVTGAGTINNQYGFYVEELLNRASFNWAFYSVGETKSYFGGKVGIGADDARQKLEVFDDVAGSVRINLVNGHHEDATGFTSLDFRLGYAAGITSDRQAGVIKVGKEQTWTSTASTQDSYMAFQTIQNGSSSEKVRIRSNGNIVIALAGLPTSDPTSAGVLWRDGTDLKVSLG